LSRPITTLLLVLLALGAGCAPKSDKVDKQIVIGLSLDTLREERWQRDRDEFVRRAEELGAKVLVQAANNNDALQNSQAENLLTQGVDVLVVAPHNSETSATIVEAAHKAGVPVIAYDRLIRNSDVDLYISFDNFKVGQLQAGYAVERKPAGNYVLIAGAPTDNNAHLYRDGQLAVLQPYVDRGDITIVVDQWANDWLASEALKIMENALTRNNNRVDAVVVSNDALAGGAIQDLGEQELAGSVVVTGQDAELSACQRIGRDEHDRTADQGLATRARSMILLAKKQSAPDATARSTTGSTKSLPSTSRSTRTTWRPRSSQTTSTTGGRLQGRARSNGGAKP
jgi:D-xylose transport system substrate-binding protein